MTYICQYCGGIVEIEANVDPLDSGTTLECSSCAGITVVDLFQPDERRRLYQDAGRLDRLDHKPINDKDNK